MRSADARLDQLVGTGAAVFRASLDLIPDPVSVLLAIRGAAGAVIDFESVYANPAMARLLGISLEQRVGRRLVEESPAYADEPVFERMRGVVETGVPVVVEAHGGAIVAASAPGGGTSIRFSLPATVAPGQSPAGLM